MSQAAVILSTWSFGPVANAAAERALAAGGTALDAAVAGATAVEDDPRVDSVGTGGLPDASGRVSLDASVMTDPSACGSVCFVRGFANPAQVARRVMERTIHVMLAGEGAEEFAQREGFMRREALTPKAHAAWLEWRRTHSVEEAGRLGYTPPMNVEERYAAERLGGAGDRPEPSHDTVCVLVRDGASRLAGVCTTSGLAFKLPGRVGDSPIIGHGLYVDSEVGAVSATGNGELIMSVCGSFLACERLRAGDEPIEALMHVLRRIQSRHALKADHQVALVALRKDGATASASLRPGFSQCLTRDGQTRQSPPMRVLLPA